MSETKPLLSGKKAITPLWIVALFVSLTETVLGVAVTQTSGGIQVALTVFVITFPLLIAGSFFGILWHKPYVFYPPAEYGANVNVLDYVEAMQRKPDLLARLSERAEATPASEKEKRAASDIVEQFTARLVPRSLMILYACSLAFSKRVSLDVTDFCKSAGDFEAGAVFAVINATSASSGLILP